MLIKQISLSSLFHCVGEWVVPQYATFNLTVKTEGRRVDLGLFSWYNDVDMIVLNKDMNDKNFWCPGTLCVVSIPHLS